MGFFDFLKEKTNNDWKKTLIKDLVVLTAVDGDMDENEIDLVLNIAVNELGFSANEFKNILQNLGDVKDYYPSDVKDKIKYMQYLMKMTFSDGLIDDNEVKYMKIVAGRMDLPKDTVDNVLKTIENNINRNEQSLEERLAANLLSNEMQVGMYNEARNLKHYGDLLNRTRSKEDAIAFQKAFMQAFESVVIIYEWLQEREILELNGIVLLTSFYLVNLSDANLKDPTKFSNQEISGAIETFLATMGVSESVDISSYNELVKIGINWLLKHPNS
jgi:uncharacterized tellurite resistance protein B-like protein